MTSFGFGVWWCGGIAKSYSTETHLRRSSLELRYCFGGAASRSAARLLCRAAVLAVSTVQHSEWGLWYLTRTTPWVGGWLAAPLTTVGRESGLGNSWLEQHERPRGVLSRRHGAGKPKGSEWQALLNHVECAARKDSPNPRFLWIGGQSETSCLEPPPITRRCVSSITICGTAVNRLPDALFPGKPQRIQGLRRESRWPRGDWLGVERNRL